MSSIFEEKKPDFGKIQYVKKMQYVKLIKYNM